MDRDELDQAARNEAAYRHLNESLRAGTTVAEAGKRFPFACECGHLGCNRILELSLPEYEAVRSEPTHFFVLEGHAIPEAEDVVERHERYAVVRKTGEQAQIARDANPR